MEAYSEKLEAIVSSAGITIVIDVMYNASVGTIPINDTVSITVKELIELMGWRAGIRMAIHQGYIAGSMM